MNRLEYECTEFLKESMCASNTRELMEKKDVLNLSEEVKLEMTDKLISTLYKLALEKYNDLDVDEINASRGDFTRFKGYKSTKDTVAALKELANLANDPSVSQHILALDYACEILEKYKKEFSLGYIQDIPFIKVMYTTIILAVLSSNAFLISVLVDSVSRPDNDIQQSINNRKTVDKKEYILYNSLEDIINMEKKGDLRKCMDGLLKKENFIGGVLGASLTTGGLVVGGIIVSVIAIRNIIYLYYNTKLSINEYLKMQAEFLDANIAELESNSTMDGKKKKQVIAKQKDKLKKLSSLADKFEVKFNTGEKKTKAEINKKLKPSEVKQAYTSNDTDGVDFGDFGSFV